MSETAWNKKLTVIVFCQFHCHMLSVCRATFTNIHSNIEYSALHTAYQFALCKRRALEMQSTHYSIGRLTLIVLDKIYPPHFFFKFTLGE